ERGDRRDGEDDLDPRHPGTRGDRIDKPEVDERHHRAEQVGEARAPEDRAAPRGGIRHEPATPSSAASTASSAGVGGLSRRRTMARWRASGGASVRAVSVRARRSARTATAEMTDTPSPAATSRLVASTLPSSMATLGRTPPRWNHASITWRMVPPRSYRISGDSARSAGRSAPRRGQRWSGAAIATWGSTRKGALTSWRPRTGSVSTATSSWLAATAAARSGELPVTITRSSSGWRARSRRRASGNRYVLAVAPVPSRTRPATTPRSRWIAWRAASSSARARPACSSSSSPACVGNARRPARSSRRAPSASSRCRMWWLTARDARHPVLVGEVDSSLIAWGSLNRFNPRPAYDHVVDFSVYVERAWRGRGVGGVVLAGLVERARTLGYHKMVLAAFPDNVAGMALYARLGFTRVGVYREQGLLDGRWVDVVVMERLV